MPWTRIKHTDSSARLERVACHRRPAAAFASTASRWWAALCALICTSPSLAAAYRYVHEVLPGETLQQIARRYRVSLSRLRRLNRLPGHQLRAGQKLKVVTRFRTARRSKRRYRVKAGDTLARIARRYKMPLRQLRRLNQRQLKGSTKLRPRQALWIVVEARRFRHKRLDLVRLRSGPGFRVRGMRTGWGTVLAVRRIRQVMARHARRFVNAARIIVQDLSRRYGGRLKQHKSHRTGRDVDIAYPLRVTRRACSTCKRKYKLVRRVDLERTWHLIKSFVKTRDVPFIFVEHRLQKRLYHYALEHGAKRRWLGRVFQYPRRPGTAAGIVRHEPGHDRHFHVRFRRGDQAPLPVS